MASQVGSSLTAIQGRHDVQRGKRTTAWNVSKQSIPLRFSSVPIIPTTLTDWIPIHQAFSLKPQDSIFKAIKLYCQLILSSDLSIDKLFTIKTNVDHIYIDGSNYPSSVPSLNIQHIPRQSTLMSVDIRQSLHCLRFPSRYETVSRSQLSKQHTGDSTRPAEKPYCMWRFRALILQTLTSQNHQ